MLGKTDLSKVKVLLTQVESKQGKKWKHVQTHTNIYKNWPEITEHLSNPTYLKEKKHEETYTKAQHNQMLKSNDKEKILKVLKEKTLTENKLEWHVSDGKQWENVVQQQL